MIGALIIVGIIALALAGAGAAGKQLPTLYRNTLNCIPRGDALRGHLGPGILIGHSAGDLVAGTGVPPLLDYWTVEATPGAVAMVPREVNGFEVCVAMTQGNKWLGYVYQQSDGLVTDMTKVVAEPYAALEGAVIRRAARAAGQPMPAV